MNVECKTCQGHGIVATPDAAHRCGDCFHGRVFVLPMDQRDMETAFALGKRASALELIERARDQLSDTREALR